MFKIPSLPCFSRKEGWEDLLTVTWSKPSFLSLYFCWSGDHYCSSVHFLWCETNNHNHKLIPCDFAFELCVPIGNVFCVQCVYFIVTLIRRRRMVTVAFARVFPQTPHPPLSLRSSHLHFVVVAPLQIIKMCQWWWARWTSMPSLGPWSCTSESCQSHSSLMSFTPILQAASVSHCTTKLITSKLIFNEMKLTIRAVVSTYNYQ